MPEKNDFVKLWQGRGWVVRQAELKPFARLVLAYLVDVVKFGNRIPGPRPASRELDRDIGQVGRAYNALTQLGFIQRQPDGFFLNHLYAWKGSDTAYVKLTQHFNTHRLPKPKSKAIPQGKRAVAEANRMLRGGS